MSNFIQTTPFETEHIASLILAGEPVNPAIHRIAIISNPMNASVTVRHMTNDDDDDGMPDGEWTTWAETHRFVDYALKSAGKCRIGISGVIVSVTLDGKEIR